MNILLKLDIHWDPFTDKQLDFVNHDYYLVVVGILLAFVRPIQPRHVNDAPSLRFSPLSGSRL